MKMNYLILSSAFLTFALASNALASEFCIPSDKNEVVVNCTSEGDARKILHISLERHTTKPNPDGLTDLAVGCATVYNLYAKGEVSSFYLTRRLKPDTAGTVGKWAVLNLREGSPSAEMAHELRLPQKFLFSEGRDISKLDGERLKCKTLKVNP